MKKIPCNLKKEVLISENEAHLYHIELLNREHDPVKKEYVDKKVVQKFAPAEYELMKSIKFFASYDKVNIFHNPTNVVGPISEDPEVLKALVARYTELFGKAPANNAKMETIEEKVAFAELSVEYQILFGAEVPAELKTSAQIQEVLDAKAKESETL